MLYPYRLVDHRYAILHHGVYPVVVASVVIQKEPTNEALKILHGSKGPVRRRSSIRIRKYYSFKLQGVRRHRRAPSSLL